MTITITFSKASSLETLMLEKHKFYPDLLIISSLFNPNQQLEFSSEPKL
jgi:hypothetical protein